MREETIKKYLDWRVFKHLCGNLKRDFDISLYMINMIDALTPIDICKQNLDLARQVRSIPLRDEILFLTAKGRKELLAYHDVIGNANGKVQSEQNQQTFANATCDCITDCQCETILTSEI